MRLPGQSNKPGNPDSQIIPELVLFASIIALFILMIYEILCAFLKTSGLSLACPKKELQ
jgi:hypothetical protein